MQPAFCDSCHRAIAAHDPASVAVMYGYKRYQLCETCSAGVLEMLRDLRVLKRRPLVD